MPILPLHFIFLLLPSSLCPSAAVEADPLLPGADELLAVADVLLASQALLPSGHPNPLAILQMPLNSNPADHAAVSRAFRRLALLLQRSNPHPGVDVAFRLVNDAYEMLSDPSRRPPPSAAGANATYPGAPSQAAAEGHWTRPCSTSVATPAPWMNGTPASAAPRIFMAEATH
ncbi:hypothetical protein GUJ93_ZPchr0011g28474 [Zizania palustris]|uniref:J domain-containing protein n=1 Tax=Zizania palustris TaxID=103762 RepID=A0A8J5WHI0_ZIZPA|nr:hypothetical protein GUJ93_ZPchr0011g28474 [Zizania palustris]